MPKWLIEMLSGIRAYHASPHSFDKFEAGERIGSGQGAASYGHGLYFAENPEVMDAYFKEFSRPGKPASRYEVNLGAGPDDFLEWDQRLHQQSPQVREKLKRLGVDEGNYPGSDADVRYLPRGQDIYRGTFDPRQASDDLRGVGIPGIKYRDQGSRVSPEAIKNAEAYVAHLRSPGIVKGGDEAAVQAQLVQAEKDLADLQRRRANPTNNYTVFDPEIVSIMRRYGIMGPTAVGLLAASAQDAKAHPQPTRSEARSKPWSPRDYVDALLARVLPEGTKEEKKTFAQASGLLDFFNAPQAIYGGGQDLANAGLMAGHGEIEDAAKTAGLGILGVAGGIAPALKGPAKAAKKAAQAERSVAGQIGATPGRIAQDTDTGLVSLETDALKRTKTNRLVKPDAPDPTAETGIFERAAAERRAQQYDISKGLLGAHPTTTPEEIIAKTRDNGGYSVNLASGKIPTSGLMMGAYRNTDPRNRVVEGLLSPEDIAAHEKANRFALGQPDKYFGTWQDGGKTYLDVSRRFEPEQVRKATKFGERSGQMSGYDVGAGKTFPVGNWEEFINSPEFAKRMTEMEKVGSDYRGLFPTEWWDMKRFENVYGPQHMQELSGLLAATSPQAGVRENVQKASEYMRRVIKGEKVVQPNYQLPRGVMTFEPGGVVPMEMAQKDNLRKAAAGDIGLLQRDKVRSMAQALMGDPDAVVLDRHWAKLAEAPERGIFTNAQEGVIDARGGDYKTLAGVVRSAAKASGRTARDYSADVWAGIRETIEQEGRLYGQEHRAAFSSSSKPMGEHFVDLIKEKAKHLRITTKEMEKRLRNGDAELLSIALTVPAIYEAYQSLQQKPQQ